jgi:hypothetical protein
MLWRRYAGIAQWLREDVSIIDRLAGAGSLVLGGGVGGVAEDGHP